MKRVLCLLCGYFIIALSASAAVAKSLPYSADITLRPLSEAELTAGREASPAELSALGRSVALPASAWEHFVAGSPPREGWRVMLRSIGATSVGLMVTGVELPADVSLRVYAADNPALSEQWQGRGYGRDKRFASRMFAGEYLVLELLWPPAVPAVAAADLPLKALQLSHGLATADSTGASAEPALATTDSFIDLCSREEYYSRYSIPSRSAVQLRGIVAGGTRYNCSATLIDNGTPAAGNRANYLLTAWHCLMYSFTEPQRNDLISSGVVWNYLNRNLPHCSTAPPMQEQRNFRLIAWDEYFDVALVRLEEAPPAEARAVFAPFSNEVPAENTPGIFSLTHPGSRTQQLTEGTHTMRRNTSFIDRVALQYSYSICDANAIICTSLRVDHSLGMTAGGSSGGGFFLPAEGTGPPELIGFTSSGGDAHSTIGSLADAIAGIAGLELALLHGEDYYRDCIALADGATLAPWCDQLDKQSLCNILEMSSQDCAAILNFELSRSFSVWLPSTETASATGHSLVSRGVTPFTSGCLEMEVALPELSQINFRWRVSSDQGSDGLFFSVDDITRTFIRGESGWVDAAYEAEMMIGELAWCYIKDRLGTGGRDRGWLDQLSFSRVLGIDRQSPEATQVEGGDSLDFLIELPVNPVGLTRISLLVISTGTGVFGHDYFLEGSNGLSISQTAAGHLLLTLEPAVSDFTLTIRPRADNILSEGDQNLWLDFIRLHTVTAVSSTSYVLSASLGWLLEDDDFSSVSGLSLGRHHGCLSLTGGGIRCWGDNTFGQLDLPAAVLYREVSAGAAHSCFLQGQSAACSGSDRQTTLFEFSDPQDQDLVDSFFLSRSPVFQTRLPSGLLQLQTIASGAWHNCAITIDNRQLCWNGFHAEFLSTENGVSFSVSISPASPSVDPGLVLQLDAGGFHSCAVLSDQSLSCWGHDHLQQAASFVAAANSTGRQFIEVATGVYHSCALTTTGTVFCGGVTYRGSTTTSLAARVPANLQPVQSLALGFGHSCALLVDGTVRCWGINNHGQASPPADIGTATAIAAGHQFSCAVVAGGADVRCWGRNNFAQLEVESVLFESRLSLVLRGEEILLPGQNRLLELSLTRSLSRALTVGLSFSSHTDESGYRILSAEDMSPIELVASTLTLTIPVGQITVGFIISATAQPLDTTSLTVSIVSSSLNLPWDLNQRQISLTLRRVIATVTVTAAAAEYFVEDSNQLLSLPVSIRLFYEGGTPVPGLIPSLTAVSSAPAAVVSTSTVSATDAEGLTMGTVSVLLGSVEATTLTIGVEGLPTNLLSEATFISLATVRVELMPTQGAVVFEAPQSVVQTGIGEALGFEVEIRSSDQNGRPFAGQGLVLSIADGSTVALSFNAGVTTAAIAAVLSIPGKDQLLSLSVSDAEGTVLAVTEVELVAVEILQALEIDLPAQIAQAGRGASVEIDFSVTARGSKGNTVVPAAGVAVEAVPEPLLEVEVMPLNFDLNGVAQSTAVLVPQGIDVQLLLILSTAHPLAGEQALLSTAVIQVAAVPILSTVTIVSARSVYLAAPPAEIAVIELEIHLDYLGVSAPLEVLMLTAETPVAEVMVSPERQLRFTGGESVATTVTVALNGAGEVLIELGIAGADTAQVVTATVRVVVIEELVALEIIAPAEVTQQQANAELQFEVQVRAMGSSGGSFNPDGLILETRSLSNATGSTSALSFSAGIATAQVTVSLSEQGSHGELMLAVISGSIRAQQRLRLLALPILSTVTVVALDSVWYALSPSEAVPVALELRLEWQGTARAERTLLSFGGTASDPAVDIIGTGTVEIYAVGSTRVVVSVTPAESLESRLEFTIVDPPQGVEMIPAVTILRQISPPERFTVTADSLLLAQQGQGQRLQTTLSVSIGIAGAAPLELRIAVRSENEVRLLEPDFIRLPLMAGSGEGAVDYRHLLTVQPAPGVDTTLVVTALLVIDTTGHRITTGEALLIIAQRKLILQVLTVIPFLPLELDRVEGVAINDLLLSLRLLPQLGTMSASVSVVENLQFDGDEMNLLQQRDDLLRLMPGLDVDHNGRVDTVDLRILLRFAAGLRGEALGAEVDQEQLEYLLGLRSLP